MEPHRTGRNEPQTPTLEPGRALGSYLVLSTLSSSNRSTVYMGQDLALDRPVALKTSPRGAVSVIAEGRILARLNHPHIVTLYGLWAQPPALILEYLVGETLKARRQRLEVLPEAPIRAWMVALLSALELVHGQGLAHGAIRSDNVFLTTDQRIKLLDFRQTSLGDAPPMPADDVRAAGRLMQELLATEEGVLADIARGAVLGRFATARAFRMALCGVTKTADEPQTEASTPALEGPTTVAPLVEEDTKEPAHELARPSALPHDPELFDLFDEPSINPMLPAFHERPGWGRPARGHRRLSLLLILLVVTGLFAAEIGWPHRQAALQPVIHVAHTVARLAHGHLPKARPRKALAIAEPTHTAARRTAIHPGAYAALAHAWGG